MLGCGAAFEQEIRGWLFPSGTGLAWLGSAQLILAAPGSAKAIRQKLRMEEEVEEGFPHSGLSKMSAKTSLWGALKCQG